MARIISSLEDTASLFYRGRAGASALADTLRMADNDWKQRLVTAITEVGLTPRSASLKAGLGPGYVHSIIVEGKDPTVGRLMALCDAINASLPFILYGVDVTPEDAAILQKMKESPKKRDAVLELLDIEARRRGSQPA